MSEDDDPTVHMLSISDYGWLPNGDVSRRPISIDDHYAHVRSALEKARRDESTIENDGHSGVVAVSRLRGLVVAELLRELAERVAPGRVVGAMRCDDGIADLAAEIAADLEAKRTAAPDGD